MEESSPNSRRIMVEAGDLVIPTPRAPPPAPSRVFFARPILFYSILFHSILFYSIGTRLVLGWYSVGTRLVLGWYSVGTRLVLGWYSVGTRLVLGWY